MLDEMLLAGELQEPSKKVFYISCFAFCICFVLFAALQPVCAFAPVV